jgi:hypothetical protein
MLCILAVGSFIDAAEGRAFWTGVRLWLVQRGSALVRVTVSY